jgi:hypothetical protein
MKRFAHYLQVHNRVRVTSLGIGFFIASVSLYIGIGVYFLTFGPKAVGDYVHDRILAGCLISIAMLVDVGTAWVFSRSGGGFLSRLLLSVLLTVGGAILVFGLIVARAVLANALSAH